jgi:hypothetical protein
VINSQRQEFFKNEEVPKSASCITLSTFPFNAINEFNSLIYLSGKFDSTLNLVLPFEKYLAYARIATRNYFQLALLNHEETPQHRYKAIE